MPDSWGSAQLIRSRQSAWNCILAAALICSLVDSQAVPNDKGTVSASDQKGGAVLLSLRVHQCQTQQA